ncbi:MAG: bacillithiol biosynthesis deacetylase BshB1 [Actinobacteria bacterium]|nr:bacillithiol biosynthesis deacetylase BshB1 [Actinomycetota bacterium]
MFVDVLAFSPHPDDADMGCGGLLLKLKSVGYKTGIIDLTEGELSSNGDSDTRKKETLDASKILKLDIRENLNIGDAAVANNSENRLKIIEVIRKYKPSLALIPYEKDRHPDHENSNKLLKDAIFISGLKNFKTDIEFHKPKIVISYMLNYQFKPNFIVDISDFYIQKMEVFAAYKSQFARGVGSRSTYINSGYFYDFITSRNKIYGLKINTEYGEPFFIESHIKIDDPVKFFDYIIF